jgi:hypothetical protein
MLELKSDVVVDSDEDKLPILELKPDVVVLKLELNVPILVEILELNVEYPVVPVIKTWIDPERTFSSFISFLILVSMELVNVLYDDVEFSIANNLPSFDDVYV